MLDIYRARLKTIIREQCVQRGEFTLASGQKSNVYIDLRRLATTAPWLRAAVKYYFSLICDEAGDKEHLPDVIAGAGFGGAMLCSATLAEFGMSADWLRMVLVRPEKKDHGASSGSRLVGEVRPNDRIIMLEDVITTGGSIIDAAIQIMDAEPTVRIERVAALVDRGGSIRVAETLDCTVTYVATLNELLEDLPRDATKEFHKSVLDRQP